MRRFLLCWLALTAAVLAGLSLASRANMVQMPFTTGGGGAVTGCPAGLTCTCQQSSNFLQRVYTANGNANLSVAYSNIYDALICGLIGDFGGNIYSSAWPILDALWLPAGPVVAVANLNLVSPSFTLVNHGASWSANRGYSGGEGSTSVYVDTTFNPSTAGGHWALGSAHLSGWNENTAVTNGNLLGAYDGTNITRLLPTLTGNFDGDINDAASGGGASVANSNPQGSFAANRLGTAANSLQLYVSGAPAGALGGGAAAATLMNLSFFAVARNDSGTASSGSNAQWSQGSVGGSLTPAQFSSSGGLTGTVLIPRVRTYLTAIGAP